MGAEESPEVALAKGVLALANGSVDNARRLFAKTHPLIAGRLVSRLGGGRLEPAPVTQPVPETPPPTTPVPAK